MSILRPELLSQINDHVCNRTCELPACSAVSHSTTPPPKPPFYQIDMKYLKHVWNTKDATVYIQTELLFSKPNDFESDSESSVRNGNNLIQLSCSYLTGPTVGRLKFEYPI